MQTKTTCKALLLPILCGLSISLLSCQGTPDQDQGPAWSAAGTMPDVAVAVAPFSNVEVKWKERFREPYIYLDNVGDYRMAGRRIAELFQVAADQGAPVASAPFILFYDDPGITPESQLRARICVGIDDEFMARSPLLVDELPQELVVYAAIGGAYSEVPRAYPKLIERITQLNGMITGPIRESYLVSPVGVDPSVLVTEVQIPWGSQR